MSHLNHFLFRQETLGDVELPTHDMVDTISSRHDKAAVLKEYGCDCSRLSKCGGALLALTYSVSLWTGQTIRHSLAFVRSTKDRDSISNLSSHSAICLRTIPCPERLLLLFHLAISCPFRHKLPHVRPAHDAIYFDSGV